MSNSIQFKWFMQNLSADDKKQYRDMSINQQKDWYISYLENHYHAKPKEKL